VALWRSRVSDAAAFTDEPVIRTARVLFFEAAVDSMTRWTRRNEGAKRIKPLKGKNLGHRQQSPNCLGEAAGTGRTVRKAPSDYVWLAQRWCTVLHSRTTTISPQPG
jgi:hypothetical protein